MAYDQDAGLLVGSKYRFYLNLKRPGDPNDYYERLARGFSSFEPGDNPEVDQTAYLDGDGFSTSTVMGAQYTITFSGHRYFGDPVQDWIFSRQIGIGRERETDLYIVEPNGTVIRGDVTLAGITGGSGGANEKREIEVEIHFNGRPEVIHVEPPANLTVSNITATGADLSWDAIDVPDGTTVTYDVYQDGVKIESDISTTSYSVTDLESNTEYHFDVVAKVEFATNVVVESIHSEPIAVTTIE